MAGGWAAALGVMRLELASMATGAGRFLVSCGGLLLCTARDSSPSSLGYHAPETLPSGQSFGIRLTSQNVQNLKISKELFHDMDLIRMLSEDGFWEKEQGRESIYRRLMRHYL